MNKISNKDERQDLFVYQIFYNSDSEKNLAEGFLPLDNTSNERPDWFEFWPIRKFFTQSVLNENAFYGFFSPRLTEKTGIEHSHIQALVSDAKKDIDVLLFPNRWDHLAYFRNVFEHGDAAHPGLMKQTDCFLKDIGVEVDLHGLVSHSGNAVFSNNVVAKPIYWRAWLQLANKFFDYAETDLSENAHLIRSDTVYGKHGILQVSMKVFIMERLSAIVMAQNDFRIGTLDTSVSAALSDLFFDDISARRILQVCDSLKRDFSVTKDEKFLDIFYQLRDLAPKGKRFQFLSRKEPALR